MWPGSCKALLGTVGGRQRNGTADVTEKETEALEFLWSSGLEVWWTQACALGRAGERALGFSACRPQHSVSGAGTDLLLDSVCSRPLKAIRDPQC